MPPLEPVSGQTQGAVGEPAEQGAASSGSGLTDEELLAALEPEPQQKETVQDQDIPANVLEFLTKVDPSRLPQQLKERLELPFLQQYTRKFQDLSSQQQRFLDTVTKPLVDKGMTVTQDDMAALRERVKSGDFDAIDDYVKGMVNQQVRPTQQAVALRNAMEAAQQLHPYVKEREAQLTQIIQNDPMARELATMNDFRYAPQVLEALANRMEVSELRAKVKEFESSKKQIASAAIQAYQRKLQGLPARSTMAGTSSSPATSPEYDSVKSAAKAAWAEMGGSPIDHWK